MMCKNKFFIPKRYIMIIRFFEKKEKKRNININIVINIIMNHNNNNNNNNNDIGILDKQINIIINYHAGARRVRYIIRDKL